ncbi:MAG: hypothetical protein WBB07_29810 [Mycobacterium sp.]
MDSGTANGVDGAVPWAKVFDSTANRRAFSAIQAEGLRAASELVDRFVRLAADGLGGTGPALSVAPPLTQDQRADVFGATDMEPFLRTWWSLVGQPLFGAVGTPPDGAAGSEAGGDAASVDLATARAMGRLEFDAPPGAQVSAVLWIHNITAEDHGEIGVRCSDLLSDQGAVIAAAAARFAPERVPMPPRCSRGIEMTLDVGELVEPGRYRGTVLVTGHPDVWLPVSLTVRSADA